MQKNAYVIPIKAVYESDVKDTESPSTTQTPKEREKEDKSVGRVIAVQFAKKAATWAVSGYGDLTGDYLRQTTINEAISAATLVGQAFSSPLGAAMTVATLGISAANKAVELRKNEQEVAFLRERLGDISQRGGR